MAAGTTNQGAWQSGGKTNQGAWQNTPAAGATARKAYILGGGIGFPLTVFISILAKLFGDTHG